VRQETQLDCEVFGLVSVSSTIFSSGPHTIDLNFVLHRVSGEVRLDPSNSGYAWLQVPEELAGLRPSLVQLILQAKASAVTVPCSKLSIEEEKVTEP
jgi:hypothetical protein